MKTHIIESGVVVNTIMATVSEAQAAFHESVCINGETGGIGWVWDGSALTPPIPEPETPEQFAARRSAFVAQIDTDADRIYTSAVGARSTEYIQSEHAALAYKTAGYTGTVPAEVHCWAVAKSQTDQWAADDILLAAARWRGAQTAIRSNRLLYKEQAKAAADSNALALPVKAWGDFVIYITAQLGAA